MKILSFRVGIFGRNFQAGQEFPRDEMSTILPVFVQLQKKKRNIKTSSGTEQRQVERSFASGSDRFCAVGGVDLNRKIEAVAKSCG